MISDYQILTASDPDELCVQVRAFLESGFQPQGGVSVSTHDFYSEDHKGSPHDNSRVTYAQAMILCGTKS